MYVFSAFFISKTGNRIPWNIFLATIYLLNLIAWFDEMWAVKTLELFSRISLYFNKGELFAKFQVILLFYITHVSVVSAP